MLRAYILACVLSFVAGLLVFWLVSIRNAAKRKKRRQPYGTKELPATPKKSFIERFGVMNLILVIIGISIFLFVNKMIDLFELYGCVPDALITCFFAVVGGECGVMGWIKTTQDKNRERKWMIEDQQKAKEEAKENDKPPVETEDTSHV